MLFLDGSIRDMLDILKCPFCGVWSSIGISTAKRSILICIFSINICSLPKDEKNLYVIMLFRVILNFRLLTDVIRPGCHNAGLIKTVSADTTAVSTISIF